MERGHRLFRAVGVLRGGSGEGRGRVGGGSWEVLDSLHEKLQSPALICAIERNFNSIKPFDQNYLHNLYH